MKNIFITLFAVVTCFLSCEINTKEKNNKNQSNSDTIKIQYYDTSKKRLKEVFLKDSILKKFYKNGKLFSEGKINHNKQRIGEWLFYTKEGNLSEIREYLILNNSLYLNQNIYFSEQDGYWNEYKDKNFNYYNQTDFSSDTLVYIKTFYAQFDLGKDTIKLNEPWLAVCYYYTPVFRKQDSESIIILPKNQNSFKSDFSNISQVEKDTFFSLRKDIKNRVNFPDDDFDYTIAFGKWFETPGKKVVRGYLSEFYTNNINSENSKVIEKLTFFEKELYVKDTIN